MSETKAGEGIAVVEHGRVIVGGGPFAHGFQLYGIPAEDAEVIAKDINIAFRSKLREAVKKALEPHHWNGCPLNPLIKDDWQREPSNKPCDCIRHWEFYGTYWKDVCDEKVKNAKEAVKEAACRAAREPFIHSHGMALDDCEKCRKGHVASEIVSSIRSLDVSKIGEGQ